MKKRARSAGNRSVGEKDVTASELAAFAYCAKAWHLEHVAGARPSSAAESKRNVGTSRHRQHGVQTRAGAWLGRHGWAAAITLLLAAVLLSLVALRV